MDTITYALEMGKKIQAELEAGTDKTWPELVASASKELANEA